MLQYNRERRQLPESKLADRLRKKLSRLEHKHRFARIRVKREFLHARMQCRRCGEQKRIHHFPPLCCECVSKATRARNHRYWLKHKRDLYENQMP